MTSIHSNIIQAKLESLNQSIYRGVMNIITTGRIKSIIAINKSTISIKINATNNAHQTTNNRENNKEKTSKTYNCKCAYKIYKTIATKNSSKNSSKKKSKKRKGASKKCEYVIQGYEKLFPRRFFLIASISHLDSLAQFPNILHQIYQKFNTSINTQYKG